MSACVNIRLEYIGGSGIALVCETHGEVTVWDEAFNPDDSVEAKAQHIRSIRQAERRELIEAERGEADPSRVSDL